MTIKETVEKKLQDDGYQTGHYIPKSEFRKLIVTVTDPITGEELRTTSMLESEYKSLPITERKKIEPFITDEIFDEKEYLDTVKLEKEKTDIYRQKFTEYLEKELQKREISKDTYHKIKKVFEVFTDYFDFDDLDSEEIAEIEDQLLGIIQN